MSTVVQYEGQPYDLGKIEDEAERNWLLAVQPGDVFANAHRIYDFMREQGAPVDSFTRELAFCKASQALGIDYDVLYEAWLNETALGLAPQR